MRLFLAAILEIVGAALLASAAFVFHPAAGLAVSGIALTWLGTELARGVR